MYMYTYVYVYSWTLTCVISVHVQIQVNSNEEMYKKTYNKSSNSSAITDNVKIMHVPGIRTATYGIKSI